MPEKLSCVPPQRRWIRPHSAIETQVIAPAEIWTATGKLVDRGCGLRRPTEEYR